MSINIKAFLLTAFTFLAGTMVVVSALNGCQEIEPEVKPEVVFKYPEPEIVTETPMPQPSACPGVPTSARFDKKNKCK